VVFFLPIIYRDPDDDRAECQGVLFVYLY
jgi:hypothetical protein